MSSSLRLDPIEELRLRRWARENFVPRNARSRDWHPIIHEEMQTKDCEDMRSERVALSRSGCGMLPVAPATRSVATFILHTSHPEMTVGTRVAVEQAAS